MFETEVTNPSSSLSIVIDRYAKCAKNFNESEMERSSKNTPNVYLPSFNASDACNFDPKANMAYQIYYTALQKLSRPPSPPDVPETSDSGLPYCNTHYYRDPATF